MVLTTSHDSMSHILMLWSTEPLNRYFSLHKDHMTSCESMQHEMKSHDILWNTRLRVNTNQVNTSPAMYMFTWSCYIM